MKSGIKYVDGMDLHGVIKAGLEDFELDYTGCKSADMILENGGNIDGIAISLCDFTDKGFLKENASQIFKDAMSVADRYNAYIVIDTENVKKASVLEQIIDECVNEIAALDVNVFIENGYTDKTNTERSIYFMKWIDYTALTLAIIGAIAWGLIGIFQFNLVSFFFGENSWFSRLIYDLVGLSGLYLLTLFGRIGRDM